MTRFIVLLILLTAGCAVGPDYRPPEVAVPKRWSAQEVGRSFSTKDYANWWRTFNDPMLDRLIDEAIGSNLDLQLTEARIREARTLRTEALAAALPGVDARTNASRRRNASTFGQSGTSASSGGLSVGSQIIDIFQLGFDAQWEIDLFGGVQRSLEAADATLEAEQENRRDILVSLLAEVARNYINIRRAQQLILINRNNVRVQRSTLELAQARSQGGLGSELEVAQALAQVTSTEAQLPELDTAKKQAVHALSILLGREPGSLLSRYETTAEMPEAGQTMPVDLPSELLKRRPDIRRAERQLAVANAQIGVATAELYPKINLAAFLGLQNIKITDFTPIGKSWSMASTLTMPIFNWGKLQANIKAKKAIYEQAFISYRSVVLEAFKEVEDALIAYANQRQRRQVLVQSVEASRLAVELANERYLKGLTPFLDVLVAQKALYQAQIEWLESEAATSVQLVALYKALGGGWQDREFAFRETDR